MIDQSLPEACGTSHHPARLLPAQLLPNLHEELLIGRVD